MINLKILAALLILFSLNMISCAQEDSKNSMSISELKNKMKSDLPAGKAGSTLIILDVRTPEELRGSLGKIDEVINIPIQQLEDRIHELDKFKDKEIAVICRSGNRSKTGTAILNANGFNAKNVLGGMIEYRNNERLK